MNVDLAYRYFVRLLKSAGQGTALGGKYLKRTWTGKRWQYEYKPVSQRGAHELTKDRFEKVTKISDSTHKDAIEKALQNGQRVNVRILRAYPDLIKKYGQEKRVEKADRINKKVKELLGKSDAPKVDTFSSLNDKLSTLRQAKINTALSTKLQKEMLGRKIELTTGNLKINGNVFNGFLDDKEQPSELSSSLENIVHKTGKDPKDFIQFQGTAIPKQLYDMINNDPDIQKYKQEKLQTENAIKETENKLNSLRKESLNSQKQSLSKQIPEGKVAVNIIQTGSLDGDPIYEYRTDDGGEVNWQDVNTVGFYDSGSGIGYASPEKVTTQEMKTNAERERKVKNLLSIIKEGNDYIKNTGKIPTMSEVRQKKQNWNNIHNEGGNGYVPDWVSLEEYNDAKNQLSQLGESIPEPEKHTPKQPTTTTQNNDPNRKKDFSSGIEGNYDRNVVVSLVPKEKMKSGNINYKIRSPYIKELVDDIQKLKSKYYSKSKEQRQQMYGDAPYFDPSNKSWYFGEGMKDDLQNILSKYLHK